MDPIMYKGNNPTENCLAIFELEAKKKKIIINSFLQILIEYYATFCQPLYQIFWHCSMIVVSILNHAILLGRVWHLLPQLEISANRAEI